MKTQCGSEDKERRLMNLTLIRIPKSTITWQTSERDPVLSSGTIPSCHLRKTSRMLSTGKLSVLQIVSPKQLPWKEHPIFVTSWYRHKWHIKINKEYIMKDIPNLQSNINCNLLHGYTMAFNCLLDCGEEGKHTTISQCSASSWLVLVRAS